MINPAYKGPKVASEPIFKGRDPFRNQYVIKESKFMQQLKEYRKAKEKKK